MLLVIDSSVVAKWFFQETLTDQALAVRRDWESASVDLIAPDLMMVEVSNIVWNKQRTRLITEMEGASAIDNLLALDIPTMSSLSLLPSAYRLASDYDQTIYNALYLALAVTLEASLLTADLRLCNAVSSKLKFVRYLGTYR